MENAGNPTPLLTARQAGLVACTGCGRVHLQGVERCERCGAHLSSRDTTSLQRVWAWWIAGLIIYFPANLYPMLITNTLGTEYKNTILGGVIELIDHHSYFVAGVVFFASIMIPVGKFIAIAYLAYSVRHRATMSDHGRQVLYEVVEFIGRWSMIDVFVVAILSSLVQFNFVANIHPGIAAISFALSVVFTMLSAQSFDPRMIWDAEEAATE
ncbi:paraquat-inducible protein A [Heliomarina baculiformis]|uniref:paraquat-inducible protein A n=1 Tax=Heliomarina baculiformis TaxID=2872036 RepID=UPI001EE28778|nr:paraquat-inducible protein A [Heliomarina baculiformis]